MVQALPCRYLGLVPDAEPCYLIAVPETEEGLARAIGEAHRRYTRRINFREGWRGHLWQERFASFVMDESHLVAAARYIEMNPVAAGIVEHAENYPWSSARAHLTGQDDDLVKAHPLLGRVDDWKSTLTLSDEEESRLFKRHEKTGRPLGLDSFVDELERKLGRVLRPQKPGPKRNRRG
jgi:putative transposase